MKLLDWLEDRTGYRHLVNEALYERIPGGARWRYVWGSTLVFTFSVQVITGIFLWMAYSPSAQTAWESVYFLQNQVWGGALLRGIHHFTAQAMVVLLVLHLMQVVIDGAYRAPREINFWLGLVLMQIVLGLSLTGYLLPWDQKGFWATRVATNLMGLVPVVGEQLQQVVVGGPTYGHATLTRFFALHAGVLPGLLVAFLVLHVYLFRRHGLCAKLPARQPDCEFWPDQVLKDAVACLAVLCVVLGLVIVPGFLHQQTGDPGIPFYIGAELGAPADPADQYSAARPEWYFLFLFQMLKYFPGSSEVVGALVVPGLVMLVLAAMPLVGRWKLGHRFNVGFLLVLVVGATLLTARAFWDDHYGRDAADYLQAVADADQDSERAAELAAGGIPPEGAIALVRRDPKIQGRKLFAAQCAQCHDHRSEPAVASGTASESEPARDGAPRLTDFASREWIAGLLDPKRIDGPDYFGPTRHHDGQMVGFVKETLPDWKPEEIEDAIIALSAEAHLPEQAEIDVRDKDRIAAGIALIKDEERCAGCHKFHDAGQGDGAPDLTGYGSREWLLAFISNPAADRFYGEHNDRMPAFAAHEPGSPQNQLSPTAIGLIVDWLRHDWNPRVVDHDSVP
ncbi:MAG TPA: cytochrome b N-terminal domain-containing protein [Pirellulales bacterium]|jgi:ubiquinol-cytochrome c reductase cytochrome b subunit|nr:cytochrome b N-terminal domain-containing protein [Pirellulales bacterium]